MKEHPCKVRNEHTRILSFPVAKWLKQWFVNCIWLGYFSLVCVRCLTSLSPRLESTDTPSAISPPSISSLARNTKISSRPLTLPTYPLSCARNTPWLTSPLRLIYPSWTTMVTVVRMSSSLISLIISAVRFRSLSMLESPSPSPSYPPWVTIRLSPWRRMHLSKYPKHFEYSDYLGVEELLHISFSSSTELRLPLNFQSVVVSATINVSEK